MFKRQMSAKAASIASAALIASAMALPATASAAEGQVASGKSETVHVYATAAGAIKEVKVTDTLENDERASTLVDESGLTGIEPRDEGQTFTRSGSALVWNADGKDVTYSGMTDADVPVKVSVTYTLGGKSVSPEELAGKSGRVTIHYSYENDSSADGLHAGMHIPFTAVTTLMFDSEDFKNVEVTNGRLVEDGDDTIAVGYAMPGLSESLGQAADDVDIPDCFELGADVVDFELKSGITLVSAGLFEGIDVDDLDTSELADSSQSLGDATAKLVDASSGLASGLGSLAEGTGSLASGASKLNDGIQGAAAQLPDLVDGISSLREASSSLSTGAGGVYEGVVGLGELVSGAQSLSGRASASLTRLGKDNAAAAAKIEEVLQDDENGLSKANAGKLEEALALLRGEDGSIAADLAALSASAEAFDGLLGQASDALGDEKAADSLIGGSRAVKEGAARLSEGLKQTEQGAKSMVGGINGLVSGARQLASGAQQLDEGAQAAAEGAGKLADGMKAYNDEAISEIIDTVDDKIVNLSKRMASLSRAADEYDNFSGIAEGTPGSVKFVIETEAIEQG